MRTLIGLFISLSWLSGVLSSNQLVQSDPGVIKSGNSHTLSCQGSGGFNIAGNTMHWIRQFSDGKLQWLYYITSVGSINYNDAIKGRFSVRRDNNNNKMTLKMDNMKTEDIGIYYCAREGLSWAFDIWGPGTTLTVTSDGIIHPQVFPLVPSHQEHKSFITFGCLAKNYLPTPVSVVWNTSSGGTLSEEKNIQFPLSGDPLRYSSVSLITVSSSQWDSNTYICDVRHFSSSIKKTIPRGCVTPPPSPTVHILQGSCVSSTDEQVELTCQGYNLTSKDAEIKWFINEKERPLPQDLLYLEHSNLYATQSTVSISMAEWNNGVRVKCQVTDTKTNKSSEATSRKCSDIANCLGIEVIMVPPTIEDLYVQNHAPIACTAYNLKQPTGSSFEFNFPGAPDPLDSQTEDPQRNLNGTYSVTSFLTVTPETWQSNTEFTCIFRFPGLTKPIIRTISKKTETKLILPNVAIYPPTPEDIAKDELCVITCIAYGFYPQQIYMGWVDEDDVEISRDQHVNSEPKRNDRNQSFSASSLLSVPCSEWKKGKGFGCLVGHEAMPMKFTKKHIDIHSGNPSTVHVSVVMSDATLSCY